MKSLSMTMRTTVSSTVVCVCTCITALLTASIATASEDLLQAMIPVYYLPEDCSNIQLTGFNDAVIVSQRADRYAPNTNCRVSITVRGEYTIKFTVEKQDIQDAGSSGACTDYFQLFNRLGAKELELSKPQCGSIVRQSTFTSNSSSATLSFVTDAYKEGTGFRIKYERVKSETPTRRLGALAAGCVPGQCRTNGAASVRDISRHLSIALLLPLLGFLTTVALRRQ